jgi:hypothetical protein
MLTERQKNLIINFRQFCKHENIHQVVITIEDEDIHDATFVSLLDDNIEFYTDADHREPYIFITDDLKFLRRCNCGKKYDMRFRHINAYRSYVCPTCAIEEAKEYLKNESGQTSSTKSS